MLQVKDFWKKYKGATDFSAFGINFYAEDGKILGLLGKNGAGKSTTIKSICGIFPFDKGQIIVNGFDIKKQPTKAKATIGYSPDDHSIYEKLTGRECLDYMGSIYGVSLEQKKRLIEKYSVQLAIADALDRPISSYSHGMKQKICLIASLLHQPKLWVLDEPMLGLDPQTKVIVMDLIHEYAKQGNTVLFSSHDIYTVNRICDYIAVIQHGHLVDFIDTKKTVYNTVEKLEKHFLELTKEKPAAVKKENKK